MLVKKYGNRRLYDTERSRYITLEELAEPASRRASSLRDEMVERLGAAMEHCGTAPAG